MRGVSKNPFPAFPSERRRQSLTAPGLAHTTSPRLAALTGIAGREVIHEESPA